jgi:hypothetical protein
VLPKASAKSAARTPAAPPTTDALWLWQKSYEGLYERKSAPAPKAPASGPPPSTGGRSPPLQVPPHERDRLEEIARRKKAKAKAVMEVPPHERDRLQEIARLKATAEKSCSGAERATAEKAAAEAWRVPPHERDRLEEIARLKKAKAKAAMEVPPHERDRLEEIAAEKAAVEDRAPVFNDYYEFPKRRRTCFLFSVCERITGMRRN